MTKDILIIGGMGPQASLLLHEKIVRKAVENGATENEDFPIITHISLPVSDFISDKTKAPQAMRFIRQRLECLWRSKFHACSDCLQHGAYSGE